MCTSIAKLCFVTLQESSLGFSGYQIAHTLAGMRAFIYKHLSSSPAYLSCEQALLGLTGVRGRGRKSALEELAALYLTGPQSSLCRSHAEDGTQEAWPNKARGVMRRSKKGSVLPHSSFPSLLALPLTALLSLITTLRCGDGESNENVKKQ